MKTIKELEAEKENQFGIVKSTLIWRINALKDVLGLIDEILKSQVKNIPRFEIEELKARITG